MGYMGDLTVIYPKPSSIYLRGTITPLTVSKLLGGWRPVEVSPFISSRGSTAGGCAELVSDHKPYPKGPSAQELGLFKGDI